MSTATPNPAPSHTPSSHDTPWEFWIDVGGTFTDCFGRRPDGTLIRHKLLSSGATKGAAAGGSTAEVVVDPARRRDPADFWIGYTFQLLDAAGNLAATSTVRGFNNATGELTLDPPLPQPPQPGQGYELRSDEGSPIVAIRYMLGLKLTDPIKGVVVKLGTTRGTNALITRRGAKTAFVTTVGFGDILRIGYQNRPRLFDLAIHKPESLFTETFEVEERMSVDGQVLVPLNVEQVREGLKALRERGIQSLAICLLHAFEYPDHELQVEAIAREVGFEEISVSHRLARLIKIVARGDTTVMDAYLNPILRAYVAGLRRALRDSKLKIMTSAGGLLEAESFVGKDSTLSGPAGGVVGFSRVAEAAGFKRAIGFDMGGTSTDVSRYDGRYDLEFETEKAGVRVVAPMMAIETVAAGGGSVCSFDGVKLVVGPDSAGADPGPACYGRGGPLAVTDLNFYLGKILPERFPFPLDRAAVENRLQTLAAEIEAATGRKYTPIELCDGFLRVANANMVKPIRSISLAKGYDPRDYLLVSFGGAAAQHICAVARELGMPKVLVHPDAGILSAYGIGMADVVRHQAQGVYQPYSRETVQELEPVFEQLAAASREEVRNEGVPDERISVRRSLDLRYRGLDAWLTIEEPEDGDYQAAYEAKHQQLYGYRHQGRPLEIVAARVEVIGKTSAEQQPSGSVLKPGESGRRPEPESWTETWFDAKPHRTAVYDRSKLQAGDIIEGPAIIYETVSTTVIDPHWQAEVYKAGELLLTDMATSSAAEDAAAPKSGIIQATGSAKPAAIKLTEPDPVMLEIFNNQFAGIAEQMGITLRNTSSSVNVKERLDFSCALFTAKGDLVVNAPHIPVHLGAMSQTVKQVLADNPDMKPGDVFVTNDPYGGGSHLPDVTTVTPVFVGEENPRLLFFTASRAHHAEIGGIRPGSMPPFSRNLAEEGVLIRNFKLVAGGESRIDELRQLLLSGPYPSRSVDDNLSDIAAQVAANQQGAADLAALIRRYGLETVEAYMGFIQQAAETKMRRALARLKPGKRTFSDHMDDGTKIQVTITVHGETATIDFTGTGPVSAGNLNANRAIVTAAVLYCLRCLIDEDIPLNEGVLAPVEIILPENCLLNPPRKDRPEECAAVVGGNVETSQRIVDVVLGALGLAAASQGTMNNTLFGDKSFGYYETVCGGAGATPYANGADAVHTHMTNTRLTDPEVIEKRYPVRVREFSIRRGSGGAGKFRGGDGIIRRLEFLRTLDVSLLTGRRGPYRPYGLEGGEPGAPGRNRLVKKDGTVVELPYGAEFTADAGDILWVETPGGGGYGKPESTE